MTNSSAKAGYSRTVISWVLVGLALGAVGGAICAHQAVNKRSRYLSQIMAVSEYQNLALLQYKHADTIHGKQSLQDLLAFMDRVEASRLSGSQDVLDFDRCLTYIRLALLDEKSGDVGAYQKDIAAAANCSKKLNNKDTSEAHLREVITKLDAYLP
jgi:uncharacterized protein YggL (DUF469 family)